MPIYIDQMDREVTIVDFPKRIISTVPSQTELLYDLGLDDRVVGITNFCIHPKEWHRNKQRIGGTKTLKIDKIRELNPDLIIANKEENTQEEIELLAKEFPVWISDIATLDESLAMMEAIGNITNTKDKAKKLQQTIAERFAALTIPSQQQSCLYLIWRKPFMTAGTDTIIHHMLPYCGLTNIIQQKRYPVVSPEEIKALSPAVILLSSEPYPFKERHIKELQELCPAARIILCDGEYFSWYGSRLLGAPAYFASLFEKL